MKKIILFCFFIFPSYGYVHKISNLSDAIITIKFEYVAPPSPKYQPGWIEVLPNKTEQFDTGAYCLSKILVSKDSRLIFDHDVFMTKNSCGNLGIKFIPMINNPGMQIKNFGLKKVDSGWLKKR